VTCDARAETAILDSRTAASRHRQAIAGPGTGVPIIHAEFRPDGVGQPIVSQSLSKALMYLDSNEGYMGCQLDGLALFLPHVRALSQLLKKAPATARSYHISLIRVYLHPQRRLSLRSHECDVSMMTGGRHPGVRIVNE
jgi:hypothetical protein